MSNIAALASGKSITLGDPAQPDCWVQASWLGELYYITGPHFEACAPEIDLGELSATGLANVDDYASVLRLLNQYSGNYGAPVTA